MSEEAAQSATEENPEDPAPPATAQGSGRGRFMILIGALLLLGGTFIGMRVARLVPPDEDLATGPGGPAGVPQVGDIPAYLHYLNVCERAEQDGRRFSLINVVAALAPPTLPSPARMTVAVAVSGSSADREVRIQGIAGGNVVFLDEPLKLDPVDPTRPFRHIFEVEVELTTADPLAFIITAGDLVIARRHLFVRPRDREPATTAPAAGDAGAPTTAAPAATK